MAVRGTEGSGRDEGQWEGERDGVQCEGEGSGRERGMESDGRVKE